MPTTINGVGTHYYGKSNKTSRSGVCRACGANARLDSYDTRLWFVVLFIPIIPLGRKRITDQCSVCRRHWVSSQAAFETAKRESLVAAMERYEKQPSPEGALELHGSLLAFRQYDQAKQFRDLVMGQYPESDVLFRGLARQMESLGRPDDAGTFFEKAFALRPDLPEMGIGVAAVRIADGRLDEARQLLKPLEAGRGTVVFACASGVVGACVSAGGPARRDARNLQTPPDGGSPDRAGFPLSALSDRFGEGRRRP